MALSWLEMTAELQNIACWRGGTARSIDTLVYLLRWPTKPQVLNEISAPARGPTTQKITIASLNQVRLVLFSYQRERAVVALNRAPNSAPAPARVIELARS